jgi:hypothetical protein
MELNRKMKYIYLTCILLFCIQKVDAQVIVSATSRHQFLNVKFYNRTENRIEVPDLSVRYGKDNLYLYEKYYLIRNDTIYLNLAEKIDKNLYSIISAEPYSGETTATFKYKDKLLLPNKTFRSKIKVKGGNSLNYLVLRYEELKVECIIK